jgi:hypothetical protein
LPQGLVQEALPPPVEFLDRDPQVQKTEGLEKGIKEEKDLVYSSEKLSIIHSRITLIVDEKIFYFF